MNEKKKQLFLFFFLSLSFFRTSFCLLETLIPPFLSLEVLFFCLYRIIQRSETYKQNTTRKKTQTKTKRKNYFISASY